MAISHHVADGIGGPAACPAARIEHRSGQQELMHKGFEMRVDDVRAILARVSGSIALTSLAFMAPQALAQDTGTDSTDTGPDIERAQRVADEVVVTGSRLKRDTYTSIAPLQVISGQVAREIGSIDPSTILQESTAASGVQIDLTFSGSFYRGIA